MQYVRSISGSVGAAWNSINPATLSGAIDVIVVEQDDGSLACSPFHVRFGKWRLLRPYEKKVEFKVNGQQQEFPMKLGEGGEAFFVFETNESVPEALQTSPLASPAASPQLQPSVPLAPPALQEPDPFELEGLEGGSSASKRRMHSKSTSFMVPPVIQPERAHSDIGRLTPPPSHSSSPPTRRPLSADVSAFKMPKLERNVTDSHLPVARAAITNSLDTSKPFLAGSSQHRPPSPLKTRTDRSESPPSVSYEDAKTRAMNLSKKLWTSNISNQVTDSGDLMLDMTGYKSSDGEALQAEVVARQLLSEEIDGPYDIGALIGADEHGNIWIYSSEEAREAANQKAAKALGSYNPTAYASTDALSDPGYHSDDARTDTKDMLAARHSRRDSDSAVGSQPSSPGQSLAAGDPNKNYAKTLRLTSDQLKAMDLSTGPNTMSFTVNRATCNAMIYYWRHDVPIVISDIDGTITKSDVLGHVLNTIGRDWTHQGVAKLYTDIASNGYNFLYLTSRSVGQADTTRNYLDGVVQEGYKLPKGPVILSPDRTIAALRREVYLRKPEIFKMACLRDIMALFSGHGGSNNLTESADAGLHNRSGSTAGLGTNRGKGGSPFYAGFGNRLTDALSYRSVNIPSTRIFTINSLSEISLDLLSLNNYKTAYGTMREIVDHYFPPVGLLVKGGGEEFTDFNYWRAKPFDIVDFTDSESEDEDNAIENALLRRMDTVETKGSILSEDEAGDDMMDSILSDPRVSLEESMADSIEGDDDDMTSSMMQDDEDPMSSMMQDEDEDGDVEDEDEEDDDEAVYSPPRTPDRTAFPSEDREATPRKSSDLPNGKGVG